MESILKNIESIRKEKGIKQLVIAKEMGITQPAYSNYITRNDDITYSRLSRIADILKVSVIDIITYPEKYVLETEQCISCKEKEETIRNLNKHIRMLEEIMNKEKKVLNVK